MPCTLSMAGPVPQVQRKGVRVATGHGQPPSAPPAPGHGCSLRRPQRDATATRRDRSPVMGATVLGVFAVLDSSCQVSRAACGPNQAGAGRAAAGRGQRLCRQRPPSNQGRSSCRELPAAWLPCSCAACLPGLVRGRPAPAPPPPPWQSGGWGPFQRHLQKRRGHAIPRCCHRDGRQQIQPRASPAIGSNRPSCCCW